MAIRIGISGWTFPPWRGTFYPEDLTQKRELEYAASKLSSIECNGTFYSLQKPSTFETWYSQVPEDFVFAVKAPQYITHIRRLKEVDEPLANFYASGLLALKEKLGPILWQFPPNVMLKDDRFETFVKQLPKTSEEALKLAKKHGPKVEGREYLKIESGLKMRHAFEFRHASFLNEDFMAFLKAHDIAFVMAHAGGKKSPYTEEVTSNTIYVRLHGDGKKYKKGYPTDELKVWASRAKAWAKKGHEVFIYFSNEEKLYSPTGALKLLELIEPRNALKSDMRVRRALHSK